MIIRTTFWRFLNLLYVIIEKSFQTKGFATVSLDGMDRLYGWGGTGHACQI